MRCATGFEIGLIGTFYFVGVIFGNLCLSHIGDVYGRLPVVRISLINATACYILMYFFADSLTWLYAIYLIFGITSTFRVGAGFLYSMEIIKPEAQSITCSVMNFCDALHIILMSLYFFFISKNWVYIHLFYTLLLFIATVMSFSLPEAPQWLVNADRYEEALKAFNYIARMNG